MSFRILYQEGAPEHSLFSIAKYIDSFAKELGLTELQVDSNGFNSLVSGLLRPDFPHVDGIGKASPFKKAANFFVWFVAARPILGHLPDHPGMERIKKVENYQNVLIAFMMVCDCLHGAEIYKKDTPKGKPLILAQRIKVSMHFLCDFVEAFSCPPQLIITKSVRSFLSKWHTRRIPESLIRRWFN